MTIYVIQSWHVEPSQLVNGELRPNVDNIAKFLKTINPYHNHIFLLQADKSTHRLFQNINFVAEEFADKWVNLKQNGCELGWHYHIYTNRLDGQELDRDAAIRDFLYYAPKVVHREHFSSGWCYLPSYIKKLLYRYVKYDYSALPNFHTLGREINSRTINRCDWRNFTSTVPVDEYGIKFIPVTMFGGLQLKLNENPKWYTELYRRLSTYKDDVFLHGYAHSYDIDGRGEDNYFAHLELLGKIKKLEKDVEFISPRQLHRDIIAPEIRSMDKINNFLHKIKNKIHYYG